MTTASEHLIKPTRAWQLTAEAYQLLIEELDDGERDSHDIYKKGDKLVLKTYQMVHDRAGRHAVPYGTYELEIGDWVVLDPEEKRGDYPHRRALSNDKFTAVYTRKPFSWTNTDGDQYILK